MMVLDSSFFNVFFILLFTLEYSFAALFTVGFCFVIFNHMNR